MGKQSAKGKHKSCNEHKCFLSGNKLADQTLDDIHDDVPLGSIISDSSSLVTEIIKHISKAGLSMARMDRSLWINRDLNEHK